MKSKLCLLILLLAPLAHAQQPCLHPDLHAAAQQVKAIQTQLLAYRLKEEMDESVPPPLQANISAFKDALASLADSALHCASPSPNPKLVESTLAKLLNATKPEKQVVYDPNKPPQLDHIYGDEMTIKVTAPPKPPNLILVELGFDIPCGDDSMLLVFESRSGQWQQALRWQSGNYDEISGAFGDFFQYQILPQKDSASWLLAVAHGNPWCTSRWSGFGLDVVQPSADAIPQQVLFNLSTEYVRETDPVMKLTPDGFQLRVEGASLDMNFMTRPEFFTYRVSGKQIVRVQPVANNGRDFVDEWLRSPWADVQAWSAPSASASLEPTHQKIWSLRDPKAKDWPSFTYGPVRTCTDSKAHFQVELDEEWFENQKTRPDKPTFFHIQTGINSFTMLSASAQPDPRCTGPDIMAKH